MSAQPHRITQTDIWAEWEGQLINGALPLRRFLGGSDHSAVFLTSHPAKNIAEAAVKLVPADAAYSESLLEQWGAAATASHPHLLRLFDAGRCQLGGHNFFYLVMEHAEQTLAQVLRQRALTPDEAKEMLPATLDALAYLHRNHLAHAQLKASNVLVVNDQLKLSSDTIRPVGGRVTTASDIWDFGFLLVEALTQRTPDERSDLSAVIESVPAPFTETVRRCLSLDPSERPTIVELEVHHRPARVASSAADSRNTESATAGVAREAAPPARGDILEPARARETSSQPSTESDRRPAAPTSSQSSTESARRAAAPTSAPPVRTAAPESAPPRARSAPAPAKAKVTPAPTPPPRLATASQPVMSGTESASKSSSGSGARYLLIGAAAMAITVGIWMALRPSDDQPITPPELADVSEEALQAARAAPPATDTMPSADEQATQVATPNVDEPVATREPAPARTSAAARAVPARAPTYAAASIAPSSFASEPAPAQFDSGSGVTLRVVPDVRANILNKIRGKVRVNVRVLVDPSGNVVGQLMEDPGPSRYFARVAAESASNWKFMPADETSSRVWLLRYVFARDGVNVDATAAK